MILAMNSKLLNGFACKYLCVKYRLDDSVIIEV